MNKIYQIELNGEVLSIWTNEKDAVAELMKLDTADPSSDAKIFIKEVLD